MKHLLPCLADKRCEWYVLADDNDPRAYKAAKVERSTHHGAHDLHASSAPLTTSAHDVAGGAVRAALGRSRPQTGPPATPEAATAPVQAGPSGVSAAQFAARTNRSSAPFPTPDWRAGVLAGPGASVGTLATSAGMASPDRKEARSGGVPPCDAPTGSYSHSGAGFLWNGRGERACGAHQSWLSRRVAKTVAA